VTHCPSGSDSKDAAADAWSVPLDPAHDAVASRSLSHAARADAMIE
jgi:hypothetical protein